MRIAKYLITFKDGSTTSEIATSEQDAARHALDSMHTNKSTISGVTELLVLHDTAWEHDQAKARTSDNI